ncbi:hypothetical protein CHRYSEOSP005_10130 [Chryseobacterium sp. Alg-005]|uniref:carboxypeptidase-like regulatory domain-containing protein n=1 Tax=Chryseobacterium sp. Alg-005 TaxID=3159516 RepID=UPI003555A365
MKKSIFLFLFLYPLYVTVAQVIKGTVVNDADQRIPNVNIYLDGTKIGTTSQEDGSFSLNLPSKSSGNIVFQKENFETFATNSAAIVNKTLKVVLIKSYEIEEVRIVPYTEEAYRNYISYFLNNFIGHDKENVKIKNQRSLKFAYDKVHNTLKVKAPKTLIIENKNLGYEIEYNLISFSADFKTNLLNYSGTSFFKETKNTDKVRLNRMNAYEGSLLHFFRSIYENKVVEEGFITNHVVRIPNPLYPTDKELKSLEDFMIKIKASKTMEIPENIRDIASRKNRNTPHALGIKKTKIPDTDYVKREAEQVVFSFKDILQVNYPKYNYELKGKEFVKGKSLTVLSSYLHPDGAAFEVSKDGNISTPDLLINEGDFSKNRIENMLPLDYQVGD